MRYPIRIDAIWRPFMLFIGATSSNSYVELDGTDIRLRFGLGFNHTIARDNVISIEHSSWPLINGLGVRAGGKIVGLIGSTSGVVQLHVRDAVRLTFSGWPWVVNHIAISLQDPDGFIEAIRSGLGDHAPEPPDPPN